MPLVEVATALGYADASAFTSAFRRWSGRAPSAWREHPRREGVARTVKRLRGPPPTGRPRPPAPFGRWS
jgi:AraC-like DNA-binding protein